ncbi:uncharacterized protein isoform X1 [Leptinotarsa decemlineata]|uniref:uncharacterized protein isoform X1 n=1 Tax=Leptinotarsa decemlineata TaxID=7539 RepID=UPI003D304DE0
MDPSTEIRKLGPKDVTMLSSILDQNDQWRCLMSIIPEFLQRNDYRCDISDNNPPKYDSEHFRIIDELKKSGRKCTEVLLSEWGCSGRIRPTIGHLLYLLVKANLFRAADYVAMDLLHQEKPKRPCNGPEAQISPNLLRKETSHDQKFSTDNHTARNIHQRIPEIIITDANQEGVTKAVKAFPADMIEFSSSSIHDNIEATLSDFPVMVNHSNSSFESNTGVDKEVISYFSAPAVPETTEAVETSVSDMIEFSNMIPVGVEEINFAPPARITVSSAPATNERSKTQNFSDVNELESKENNSHMYNIPDLTGLNFNSGTKVECDPPTSLEESVMFPAISVSHNECEFEDSNFLPALSKLHLNSNLGSVTLDISSQGSSDDSIGSASCASPLPVLSLDTRLPHFNYSSLLTATNNFDIRPFSGPNEGGRLLGSGEFGSVFLALGLLDKPVAVKKLFLENEVVSVDDEVTKQFRNEVEVLSKYKHENLLNLLGFSCDGCTYCLLYDFIPGGSLKNRLQEPENVLKWKSRLSISIGISKAVSYLHAAFATPLIHRDINSSNILLVSDNNPKLADFGLIKLIPNQNNAVATMVYGTSAYMAREAFGGDISVKLDTFSFGVVLLELITSLPPLDDNRTGNDLVTHIEETIDDDNILPLVDNRAGSWEEENVNYAVELFKVAQSCLKEKRKRPTMVDVKMTLDELTKNVNLIEF